MKAMLAILAAIVLLLPLLVEAQDQDIASSKIAFSRNGKILTIKQDGTGLQEPTQGVSPSWSPDGTKIAFSSNRNGKWQIYTMSVSDTSTGNIVNLSNNGFNETRPRFSPDGTKILFLSSRGGAHVMDSNGSNQQGITSDVSDPCWSPNSKSIMFGSSLPGNMELYSMNIDGSRLDRGTDSWSSESQPAISPQGRIVCVSNLGRVKNSKIMLIEGYRVDKWSALIDGGEDNTQPCWSPDGSHITFVRNGKIFKYKLLDGVITQLTAGPDDSEPSWSSPLATPHSPPTTPAGLTVGAGQNLIFLSWLANPEPDSVKYYTIYRSRTSGFTPVPADSVGQVLKPGTSLRDSSLIPGMYHYRITAVSVFGLRSGFSIQVSATVPDSTTVPATPDSIPPLTPTAPSSYSVNGNRFSFSWTANADSMDVARYIVYQGLTSGFTPVPADSIGQALKPGTSFSKTMSASGTFYFRIAAVDTAGNRSGFSPAIAVSITIPSAPAPRISILTPTLNFGDSARLGVRIEKQLRIKNEGTIPLAIRRISIADSAFSVIPDSGAIAAGRDTFFIVSFLPRTSGRYDTVAVVTSNDSLALRKEVRLLANVPVPPDTIPPSITAFPKNVTVGNNSVTFSWESPAPDLSRVIIYRSRVENFSPAPTDSVGKVLAPAISFTDSNLAVGTYYYRIRAWDNAGNSALAPGLLIVVISPPAIKEVTLLISGAAMRGDTARVVKENLTIRVEVGMNFPVEKSVLFFGDQDSVANPVSVEHIYRQPGTYNLRLVVKPQDQTSVLAKGLVVEIVGVSKIEVRPTSLADTTEIGASSQKTLLVRNTGNATLIGRIKTIGADTIHYYISPTEFRLNPGDSTTVIVTFTPKSLGRKSVVLVVESNAANDVPGVSLFGLCQDTTAPTMPSNVVATIGSSQVTLTWDPNTEADLSHYLIFRGSTADFSPAPTNLIARVNKESSSFVNGGVAGGTYYYKMAAVDSIGHQSPASPAAAAVLNPSFSQSKNIVDFGEVGLGRTREEKFTVANTGRGGLWISTLRIESNDSTMFDVEPFAPNRVLAGGDSLVITVKFFPTALGRKLATVLINYQLDGGDKISTALVRGTGVVSADFTGDGRVDFQDFLAFGRTFQKEVTPEMLMFDLNLSGGKIDFADFLLFSNFYKP